MCLVEVLGLDMDTFAWSNTSAYLPLGLRYPMLALGFRDSRPWMSSFLKDKVNIIMS